MPFPERLRPVPATADDVASMTALCNELEELVIAGAHEDQADDELRADLSRQLERWHGRATRTYRPIEFKTYYGAVDTETFVREALATKPTRVEDLAFQEAVDIFESLANAEGEEWETSYWLGLLEANFPNSNASDLIYWPDQWFGEPDIEELTSEQRVEAVMQRARRRLPDAPAAIALPYPVPS